MHDLAGVAAKLEGGRRAVLFERVKGHEAPVFTGLYWSRALLGGSAGAAREQLPSYVSRLHQGMAAAAGAAGRGRGRAGASR